MWRRSFATKGVVSNTARVYCRYGAPRRRLGSTAADDKAKMMAAIRDRLGTAPPAPSSTPPPPPPASDPTPAPTPMALSEGARRALVNGTKGWVAPLTSRCIVQVHGPDAGAFLQRMSTADISSITPDPEALSAVQVRTQTRHEDSSLRPDLQPGFIINKQHVHNHGDVIAAYTMFLTQHGKLLYDAIVIPTLTVESSPEHGVQHLQAYWLDIHVSARADLLKHLRKYRLRSKVELTDMSEELSIFSLGGPGTSEVMGATQMKSFGVDGMKVMVDPRLSSLGLRAVVPMDMPTPAFDPSFEQAGLSTYDYIRQAKGVAEGPHELPPGKLTPLECNVVPLNGISFDKGCYLGQELQARTHHTGVIRKRVLPLHFSQDVEGLVAHGSDIQATDGKKVGTVLGVEGNVAIGMVRLQNALSAEEVLTVLPGDGSDPLPLTVTIPEHVPIS